MAILLESSVPGRSECASWCATGAFWGNALASSEGSIENVPSSFLTALNRPDFMALLSVDLLFEMDFAALDKVRNDMEHLPFFGAPF